MDEHTGPIASWSDFERYPWPDPLMPEATASLEWFQRNLPDDMCIVSGCSNICEHIVWLMGYETFCYSLHDNRELVLAIKKRVVDYFSSALELYLSFDRVRVIFASDDMGFRNGLLFSARDMIELVLEPHRQLAERTHESGRLYLLHSCGNLSEIMDYLIDEVKIDGKHSFEDTIEDVRHAKHSYGHKTSLIGGIDVDFLCRSEPGTCSQSNFQA